MKEHQILKERQFSNDTTIINESQTLKEHQISKQTQIMNPTFQKIVKLQMDPVF